MIRWRLVALKLTTSGGSGWALALVAERRLPSRPRSLVALLIRACPSSVILTLGVRLPHLKALEMKQIPVLNRLLTQVPSPRPHPKGQKPLRLLETSWLWQPQQGQELLPVLPNLP